jgi:hypothetical protein
VLLTVKKTGCITFILLFALVSGAQPGDCVFQPPQLTINFGSGNIRDLNISGLAAYRRVGNSCPSDGHYSFTSFTGDCFHGDWHTLTEDHTAGDNDGNMLLVNAAPYGGMFLNIPINGLKGNTLYELGLWLMNLCRPTKKCPSLLLPSLSIRLETPEGKIVANIVTRDLPRVYDPRWDQHRAFFTTPASTAGLRLVMTDNAPGGCGNDFALDDITFRECIRRPVLPPVIPKTTAAVVRRAGAKPPVKKGNVAPPKKTFTPPVTKTGIDSSKAIVVSPPAQKINVIPPPPEILKSRENALVKRIETKAGKININIYDNGEIDGDTVSIYHNNVLVRSHQRLTQKPITINLDIDPAQPHHELVMVAENLGSIPPNTSVMIITTEATRYAVFITSTEQKNARVVFDLKQ